MDVIFITILNILITSRTMTNNKIEVIEDGAFAGMTFLSVL